MECPCGSTKSYRECCEPYLQGVKVATSALDLMRSRYCAYTTANGKYLVDTTDEENRYEGDAELIVNHAATITWIKLEILSSDTDSVEFKAYYQNREDKSYHLHHEKSTFTFKDGRCFYHSGKLFKDEIKRNEPCPCGSGKKYKKCCFK